MRKAAAPPPPRPFNGTGGGSGSVSAEDSDSMSGESLEGRMELTVYLPEEKTVRMSVERRTPMMDLLVQVTKANNLSPVGFVLKLNGDNNRDPPPYKPSSAIGSLSCNIIHVVPKSSGRESTLPRKDAKIGSQPFEKTFRLRVHLPRNQLHVLRVSPNTPLVDVFRAICMDRELSASKYELRHPIHREERLDPQRCLADYGLSEVAIVAVKEPSSGLCRSSSDIMALQQEEDRKKRGFFGFMFKKNKSSIGDTSSDGHSSRGVSPARSDNSEIQSISPPPSAMEAPVPARRIVKKRAAPPPPQTAKPAAPKPPATLNATVPVIGNGDSTPAATHSRNSSDSSGYHEASILSDSPESANGLDATDGRHQRPLSAQQECKVAVKKGPAPSNLTLVNSTSALSVLSAGQKKRKAPTVPVAPSVSSVSAPSAMKSSPPPQLLNSSPPPTHSPVLPADDGYGNVANSTTSNLTNVRQEHQVNGNGHSRSSSISSGASSTEEVQNLLASPPPPIPVPRQSKPPVSMTSDEIDHERQNGNIVLKEVPDFDAPENVDRSSRRTSTSSTVSRSSQLDNQLRSPLAKDIKSEISEIHKDGLPESVTEKICESDRRSSTSSSVSHCSKSSSKLVNELENGHFEEESRHSVIDETLSTLNITAAERKEDDHSDAKCTSTNEVFVQTNFDLETIPAPIEFEEERQDDDSKPESSFENSKVDAGTQSTANILPTSHNPPNKGGLDLSDLYTEVPESINTANTTNINLNEFHNQFNLVRHSITSRWGRLVSLPNIVIPDYIKRKDDKEVNDVNDEELTEDDDDSLSDVDISLPVNPVEQQMSDFASSEIVNGHDGWKPQEVFEENNTLDINAKLDLETATDVYSSVDESVEAPLQQADSNADDLREVETWEYSIPEVPPPPQFDNDYLEESEIEPANVEEDGLPEIICEVPPEFQNNFPEVETHKILVADSEPNGVQHSKLEEKLSVSENTESIEKPKEIVETEEISEIMAEASQSKQEKDDVRRFYRRPIVKFSIDTYKKREAEDSYQNRLSKAESFSIRTSSDKNELVTKYESSSLPRATTFKDKPNVGSISGQSKAISEAIIASSSSEVKLNENEKVAEFEQKDSSEDVLLRRSKSEMKLDLSSDGVLANTSLVQSTAEQERLQNEYKKLHDQFMQWQQQLMQNQALLQQQQISPESTTETLKRMQELQQQFSSLPSVPAHSPVVEIVEKENGDKTNSLTRPKSEVSPSVSRNGSNTNSLERQLPRIGPKPWRPASVSITAWNPKRTGVNDNSLNSIDGERTDKFNRNISPVVVNSNPAPVKDSTTPSNAKPVVFVNRNPHPVTSNFPKWPVVKGFVLEPQPKSKVVLNSEKSVPQANGGKTIPSIGSVEVKIESAKVANGKPAVAKIGMEDKNANKTYVNGSAVNNHVNNVSNKTQTTDASKRFTTVVNFAQKPSQTPVMLPPPPPPPPAAFEDAPITKPAVKRFSSQRSISSNGSEDGRDELMIAIKDFGGRAGLRKISSSDASWQQRYGNAY